MESENAFGMSGSRAGGRTGGSGEVEWGEIDLVEYYGMQGQDVSVDDDEELPHGEVFKVRYVKEQAGDQHRTRSSSVDDANKKRRRFQRERGGGKGTSEMGAGKSGELDTGRSGKDDSRY